MANYQIKKNKSKKNGDMEYIEDPKTEAEYLTNCILEALGYKDRLDKLIKRINPMQDGEKIKKAFLGHIDRVQYHIRNLLGYLHNLTELLLDKNDSDQD